MNTLLMVMVKLAERAPVLFIACVGAWPAMALMYLLHGEPDDRRAIQAAESSARAQWVQVYWERRQALALEVACEPAWMDQ